MDLQKIFAEIGRMHLEIAQLREQLADALAAKSKSSGETPAPNPVVPAAA